MRSKPKALTIEHSKMAKEFGITEWRGDAVFTLATEANVAAMKKAGLVVERDVKTHFTTVGGRSGLAKEGRVMVGKQQDKRGSYTKFHYRSKPGEAPAVETGVLRASMMTDVSIVGLGVTGKVGPDIDHIRKHTDPGTDVEYALYLELGTRKMASRPFLRPALARTKRKIKAIFVKANS